MARNLKVTPVTNEAIVECARELGIPEEAMTFSILKQVRKGLKLSSITGNEAIKEAIFWALKS